MKAAFKKYKIAAVVAAVIILPLAYSYLYLWAFWDPYSHLNDLPIAVVNVDKGATIGNEFKNIGNEVIDELKANDDVKWVFTTPEEAAKGLDNRQYYGEVVFPENFTEQIATVDSPDKIQGLFLYKINEKRNFLAGQVMNRVAIELKDKITKNVSKEIVKKMTDEMKTLPDSLTELNDGLKKIDDGSRTLYEKMGDLMSGQKKFGDGISSLDTGLQGAVSGSVQLKDGANALNGGLTKLSGGLTELNANMPKLQGGAEGLETGLKTFNESIQKYTTGTTQYIDGVNKSSEATAAIAASLQKYVAAHPEAMKDANIQTILKVMEAGKDGSAKLKAAGDTLKASAQPLTEGSDKLAAGSTQLKAGLTAAALAVGQLADGSKALSEGATKLADGTVTLNKGLVAAKLGTSQLVDNSGKLLDGEKKIREGINKLEKGVDEASTGVGEAVDKANSKVKNIDQVDVFVSDPVKMQDEKVNPIPDYGTAFTPYFVSLSLWVGALMMFFAIYLDQNVRFRRKQNNSKGIVRFLAYTGIGVAQAAVVAFVLMNSLHLTVKSVGLFYLSCIVISLAFVSIMRFLLVHIGDVGKFLGVLFLILQLTACGGTFPMELVPQFFQDINPYMPMTYSVNVLKEVISGIDYNYLNENMLVLIGITLVFTALNLGVAKMRRMKKPEMDPIF